MALAVSEVRVNRMDKRLLTIKEVCEYLGIGMTKARELVRGHNGFGIKIGNKWYADLTKLNKWIESNTV